MINEIEFRRDDIDVEHSRFVVMSDGQEPGWLVPLPWCAINPLFVDGKPATSYPSLTLGTELDELVESIRTATDPVESVIRTVALGAHLLRKNYDLSDAQLNSILVYRIGDPDSVRLMRDLCAVALGISGPKP